jgi:hypothetical protein
MNRATIVLMTMFETFKATTFDVMHVTIAGAYGHEYVNLRAKRNRVVGTVSIPYGQAIDRAAIAAPYVTTEYPFRNF